MDEASDVYLDLFGDVLPYLVALQSGKDEVGELGTLTPRH